MNKKIILFTSLMLLALPAGVFAAATCNSYASKQCVSNISYWYDSCGNIQAVNQNCKLTNQMCSGGVCVNKSGGNTGYNNQGNGGLTGGSYIQNFRTSCYNGNVQWYDSNGGVQGTYQNCADTNSCTLDSCADNACKSQLKCDGSTCAQGSADYATYCANNVQGQTQTQTQTNTNTTNNTSTTQAQGKVFSISIFGKKQSATSQWSKNVDAAGGNAIEFFIVVKNIGNAPMDALVSADLTGNISYTGNLAVDGAPSAGSVTSGIDVGMLPANTSRSVYFTGAVQAAGQATQVIGRVTSGTNTDSDFFTVNSTSSATGGTVTGGTTAAVSSAATSSPFFDFVKKWYLWVIIIIVLIVLFIIIFRRLSTNP